PPTRPPCIGQALQTPSVRQRQITHLEKTMTGHSCPNATERGRARMPGTGKQTLFLLASGRFLGGPEGNTSAHGLLLDRSGSTAEFARDRARGSSRLRE